MARGRIPKPWKRKSTDTWYVWLDGRQVPLGKTKREAFAEFARITVARGLGSRPTERITVRELGDLWLLDCERRLQPSTIRSYQKYVDRFCETHGGLMVRDLRPYLIANWVEPQAWTQSTRHLAIAILKAVTAWGKRQGYLDRDPIEDMDRPEILRRAPITPAEAEAVMKLLSPPILVAMRVLLTTGLRPGELCSMTVEGTDLVNRRAIVSGKRGVRTIPLSEAATATLGPLLANRSGPVFVGGHGVPLTVTALERALIRVRRKAGLGEHITPHCFRGLFSTEALRRGVDSALVSKLLGHSDPSMLMRHYAAPDEQMLRDAADRATRPSDSSPDTPPDPEA